MKFLATITLTLLSTISFGQTLSTEIESIYTFKPSKLSGKEQETKLPALDKFWNEVKSDTAKYLPQLRSELRQTGHNPFFYYDGSGLLLSLSESKSDKELVVNAMLKSDLDDIDRKIYVTTLNKLAQDGVNVTPAAVRILHDDDFSFFLPQHAMTFNQGYCLSYMLLPQTDDTYVDTLIKLFPTVSKPAKVSIITILWFAYSCKGDSFLKGVTTNQKVDAEVRAYAKKIMQPRKLTKDEQEYINEEGKEHLEEMRIMSLKRFSDEAIDELDLTTRVMRSEKNCH